jgi:hypothetical protein
VKDIINVLSSVKLINEKRNWFKDNNITLSENFGEHYKGEETNWDNIKNYIYIVEQIIECFGKKQIPNKFINYLISCKDAQDSFIVFKASIDDINNKNIVMRLNNLLNIKDNQAVNLNKIICTLEAIEKDVDVSYSKYVDFSSCSKSTMQYETIMTDIILLNRIQEIEAIVDNNSDELQAKFDFVFNGMNTNWNEVLSSLEYADKFNNICKEYSLSNGYINDVCYDKGISEWAIKYSEKLKEKDMNIKMEFEWFADLFDNGEDLYCMSIYTILDRIEKSININNYWKSGLFWHKKKCREVIIQFAEGGNGRARNC